MQQDFIDTFPDDWDFKLQSDGGLKVTKANDGPCYQLDKIFYNPYNTRISQDEWEEVIRKRFEEVMEQHDLPAIDVTFENVHPAITICEANVQYKSYADAFYVAILEEGSWDAWG
jgi:hypothetical protein